MITYNFFLYLLSPLIILKILIDSFFKKGGVDFFRQRVGFLIHKKLSRVVWIHASSIGEAKIALNVFKELYNESKEYTYLITTTTYSSKKLIDNADVDVIHYYLPFDFYFLINRFLKNINPKICIIIETEIWPNLIKKCNDKEIPIIIVNGRLSKKTLNTNSIIRNIYKECISYITHVYCKSQREMENYLELGMEKDKLTVIGNLKLCEQFTPSSSPRLVERKYVLAASTHKDEERQIITEWLKVNDKRIMLVIVPRHPERLGDILSDIPLDLIKISIRSKNDKIRNNTQIYIADTYGELESFIEHSEFVFFGGSLIDHGGQNFLEAAAYGKSIIVGPYMYNFIDETEEFLKSNSMIMVKNSQSLKHVFEKLIKSKQRRELFGNNAKSLLLSKSTTLDQYKQIILGHLK